MTEDQNKKLKTITMRWHNAEQVDNRKISQAIFDISYLTGIIFSLEEQLGNLKNPRP